ncbi:heavy metal translocating P-type ATPase [Haloarcula salinisoli]|uniref:Cation-translocating P-type ATPase n=1 Tax=Haloarcula salinisoli TaxID=2487746 RepID=A0A8J7Y9Y5_9EURY|nr:cation-translocating P-type ATPase [Halomicroarcula salinisoli]MBX0302175.1 cation-translocating P-type ATPase [Halomicroarcula salinisoli]
MTDCTLCGLATDDPVTDSDVAGSFCCRGCLEVARTLDEPADTDPEAVETGTDPDDAEGETTFCSVSGMHCATCELFLERRATTHDGIRAASASYATGTLRVTYDPDRVDADALPDRLSGTGYEVAHRGADTATDDQREGRLLVGGFFGMMTMLWYLLFLYPAYLGLDFGLVDLEGAAGAYLLWNTAVMTAVVVGYTGWPLLRGAVVSLRTGRPNMDLLVAMAATTAFAYSVVAVLLGRTEVYFDVATVIVLAVSVGDYYRDRVRRAAAGRLTDLSSQRVQRATLRTDAGTETVAVDALAPGDEVVVGEGERIPVDGQVAEGAAGVDESLVTGESLPVRKMPGDDAVGGALVTDGEVVVRVGPDAESTVDRLTELLWRVQSERGGVQRLVDRVAAVFVPLVVGLAVLAGVGHLVGGAAPTDALLTGLAVLVVSCPCALGLATPLATAAGVRAALDEGVVVTDGSAFETASEVDVVAFDKTGTLTTGAMWLVERPDDDALWRAAAVEQFADHPLATAITEAAQPSDTAVEDVEHHPGRGVSGTIDGERVVVGTPSLLADEGLSVPERLVERCGRARADGQIPALVGWDGRARDVVVGGDQHREEWETVVESLSPREVVVITGDGPEAAAPFERHDAVDEVFAGVPPDAKAEVVERLQSRGTVAMVGDGTNDAPALGTADLGIALSSGTALAADAAEAVVTTGDLGAVPRVFELTTRTRRRIRENLAWAFCYNAVALPLALLGLLNPLFAALAMTASSLLVVANSARSLGDGESISTEEGVSGPAVPATGD